MAATVHTWTNGNADGDWNNVANWNTAALPGSGGAGLDDCIFDGSVTNTGPSVNMDRTADNELLRIVVRENFTGDIGGTGNPLIHDMDVAEPLTRIIHRGSGDFYWQTAAAGYADIVMDSPGTFYADGDVRNIFVKSGTVNVASTCDFVATSWLILDGAAAIVTMADYDATEQYPPYILLWNGTFNNNRELENGTGCVGVIFGGTWNQAGKVRDGLMLMVGPAGTYNYTSNTTGGAVALSTIACAGKVDMSALNYNIGVDDMFRGQLANMLGTAIQSGYANIVGVDLDLREEYP
jgi:hypothetical protein